jgi:hypothetical protein
VFTGGLGIPLYVNESKFHDTPVELIWAVSSAIQTFVSDSLGSVHGKRSSSDLKSGNIRLVTYDPFVDLEETPKGIDVYTVAALQDRYDNIEITNNKLSEIHNLILPLGLDRPNASFSFRMKSDIKEELSNIVLRTQELSKKVIEESRKLIREKMAQLEKEKFIPLKISIADIDNGLILAETSKHLYEDPTFTDLVLSNIVAENPADSKSIWIEREAPLWVTSNPNIELKEVFTLDHIGQKTDFRLLARICFNPKDRGELKNRLEDFSIQLAKIISKH